MAYDLSSGNADLRAKVYDKTIKNLAPQMFKFMEVLNVDNTSAWKNYFWREDPSVLTVAGGIGIRGLAPGAQFPTARQKMELVQATIDKYGLEQSIAWEDILTTDVDIQERALFKLAEGVAKSVDDQIYAVLSDNDTSSAIFIYNCGGSTIAGWNQTSSTFIDDLLAGQQLIAESNLDADDLVLFVNPREYRSAMRYITDKGAQFTTSSDGVLTTGKKNMIAGIQIKTSNSVPVSRALLVKPKVVGTWKSLVPLQTTVIEDKFRNVTVRVVQEGVCQMHQPKSVVLYKFTNRTN